MARKKNRHKSRQKRRRNASNGTDSLELRSHLESLPQELYDYIYDLTFTADAKVRVYARNHQIWLLELDWLSEAYSEQVVTINEKPPHLLHVDRSSRTKFAASYFGGASIFVVVGPVRYRTRFSQSHLGLIRVPHYMCSSGRPMVQNNDPGFRSILSEIVAGEAFADRLVFTTLDETVELVKQYAGAVGQGESRWAMELFTSLTFIVDGN
ncbi:hypothetical protein CKM354_000442400 [Cercospora kikuchii]|uniref:Uncharacterized protein n=1 Tax=Cercospora kikuchii TaxID=84275 RepID=A0A9P3CE42_9PEZI|nr:uncharacterized protein CKM354_000442400 [Cercospora kikuchii]GIZ41108.1 hypothetical protein CKM354_000442400 [Cercospora kikuchii]